MWFKSQFVPASASALCETAKVESEATYVCAACAGHSGEHEWVEAPGFGFWKQAA